MKNSSIENSSSISCKRFTNSWLSSIDYLFKDDMSSLIWIYQEKSLFQNIHFSFFIPIGSLNTISFYPKIAINKITIFRTKWKWNNI